MTVGQAWMMDDVIGLVSLVSIREILADSD